MATKASQKSNKKREEQKPEFYEMMPNAYMDAQSLFDASDHDEETVDAEVRRKIVRQLAILVALLLMQFILFAILLQSTVNLG